MVRSVMVLCIVVLVFVLPGIASATICAPLYLTYHAPKADTVCTGSVIERTDCPMKNGVGETEIRFAVDRVQKGDVTPGSTITIRHTRSMGLGQMLTDYDLVLLNKKDDSYVFFRGLMASMPVEREAHMPLVKPGDAVSGLRWEVLNSLRSKSPKVIDEALRQGSLLTASDVAEFVQPLTAWEDRHIKCAAWATCVELDSEHALLPAFDLLRERADRKNGERASSLDTFLLVGALETAEIKAEQIDQIAKGLDSKSIQVRQTASKMLRNSKLPEAKPYLRRALDDTDSRVRYNAVLGLAVITGDHTHGPAYSIYQAHERQYCDYWRSKVAK